VELSDEQHDDYDIDYVTEEEEDDRNASDKPQNDFTTVEVTTQKIATTVHVPAATEVTAVTFVDLLRRARRKHRRKKLRSQTTAKQSEALSVNLETTETNFNEDSDSSFDSRVISPSSTSPTPVISKLESKSDSQEDKDIRSKNRQTNMVKKRKRISQQLVTQNVGMLVMPLQLKH
jgi:hypothetical protein